MIGPLTTAPHGFTHVLVAIDKFAKWIEYKPIITLPTDVVSVMCNILHRFGFPNTIITDPWANGQVERANSLILDGLKKRLFLPHIRV
jgi:hypothetical protein